MCLCALLLCLSPGFGADAGDDALPAPQASLMDSVARGVIMGGLPWGWIAIGGFTAVVVILLDAELARRKIAFKLPVLGFAVGFYLPMATGVPIMVGALSGYMAEGEVTNEASEGVLFAGGLITGEALMGIALAIPIAASSNTDILNIVDNPMWFNSILIMIGLSYTLYYVVKKSNEESAEREALLSARDHDSDHDLPENSGARGSQVARSSIMSGGSSSYGRGSECELSSPVK
jgi:hypothetical protein